jgi:hypothetical protein
MTDRSVTAQQLDEYEALINAATPAPWSLWRQGQPAEVIDTEEQSIGRIWQRGDAEFIAATRMAAPALVAEVRTLRSLVRDFLDPDPCSLDHHGYCQTHGWLTEGPCPHATARQMLRSLESTPSEQEAAAAPSTGRAVPSRRAGLRDEIAAAIWERQNPGRRYADCEYRWKADAEADADAVLAVLPAPADRAAILLEAARILRDASGSYGSPAYDYELGPGLADAANRLDAMADEAQEQLDEAEAQAHLDALAPIAEGTPLPTLDGPTLYEKLTAMFSGPLPPWPDSRPDLVTFRERIAEDLYAHDQPNWRIPLRESDVEPVYRERASAVLTGLHRLVDAAAGTEIP